jgi:hypothetical protein
MKLGLIPSYNFFTNQETVFSYYVYFLACFVMSIGLYTTSKTIHKAVTDYQNSKQEILKMEKSTSINQIAAFVSHEVNNPLNFILTQIHILENHIEELESLLFSILPESDETLEFRKKLEYFFQEIKNSQAIIYDGSIRIRDIITETKALTSLHGVAVREVDLKKLIQVSLSKTLLKYQLQDFEIPFNFKNNLIVQSNSAILSRVFQIVFAYCFVYSSEDISKNLKVTIEKGIDDIIITVSFVGLKLDNIEFIELHQTKTKTFGLEQFGVGFAKDLANSINCELSFLQFGTNDSQHKILIKVKEL